MNLGSSLRTYYGKICKMAIACFFRDFLTLIVHELWRHLSENVGLSDKFTEILSVDLLPSFRMPFAASRYVA